MIGVVRSIALVLFVAASVIAQVNERIFYNAYRYNNTDIYISRDAGMSVEKFTDHAAIDYDATITPDGKWIIFTSERTGKPNLFIKPADGSSPERQLLRSESMQNQAVVSPDGTAIAFVSTHADDADIYIAPFDPNGEVSLDNAKNLTAHPGGDFRPAFSPDGSRIAFTSDRGHPIKAHRDFAFARRRTGDIWLMNADGSGLKRLTDSDEWDGSPEWSADGHTIFFYSRRTGHERIFKMAADGSGQEPVSPEGVNAVSPKVLTNGSIIYASWTDTGEPVVSHRPKMVDPDAFVNGELPEYEVDLLNPDTHPSGIIVFHGGPVPPADKNKGGFRGDVLVANSPVQTSVEGTPVGLYGVRRAFVASPDSRRPVIYFSASAAEGSDVFTPWLFAVLAFPTALVILILLSLIFLVRDRKQVAFWRYLILIVGIVAMFAAIAATFFLMAMESIGPIWQLWAALGAVGIVLLLLSLVYFRQRSRRRANGDARSRVSAFAGVATLSGAIACFYVAAAFTMFFNLESDFYHYNYDSNELTKIFSLGSDYWTHPAFAGVLDTRLSPDGRRVTFTTGLFRGGETDVGRIWTFDFESKKLERSIDSGMNDGFGDFSADGKKTVLRSSRSGNFDIYISENGEARNLTNDEHKDNFPTISPDGTKIAFSSDREGAPYGEDQRAMDIFLMELQPDGTWSTPKKLTGSKGQNAHAHFSPDGQWLVYSTEDYGIADEEPLVQNVIFNPQMYGEIVALRLSDMKALRLTHNKWEDGTPIWTTGY